MVCQRTHVLYYILLCWYAIFNILKCGYLNALFNQCQIDAQKMQS